MSAYPSTNQSQRRVRRQGYSFPPGPRRNLLWNVLRTLRPVDPLAFFAMLARDYGDMAHYRVGRLDVVFVNHPDYVREVLVAQSDAFIKERTVQRMKLLVGEGMITAEGSAHRTQRQAAQPAFHRQRIPAYADTIVRQALRTREAWQAGATYDVSLEMMHLALAVVGQALFSTELGDEVREIAAAINDIMRFYHFMIMLPAVEHLVDLPLPLVRRFRRNRSRVDGTVLRMIREHRLGLGSADDLLALMLRADGRDDRRLRDEVITMFLAGYETVSNALTWTWYLLSQNPEAERRLHAEVDEVLAGRTPTGDDYPRLPYAAKVLAESMRLYPPAWGMGRRALEDFALGPYRFRAGTTVAMSQFILHRDARYFPDPQRFDPERFTPEAEMRRPKFCYFPFGAGKRQCIGESFAWMEGVLVLATLAQRWRLRLVPGHPVAPEPLITLRPRYGMRMLAEERNR